MSALPEVRRADCGHGLLPIDTPPSARMQNGQHEQAVYLCDDCRARLNAPRVETKDVRPDWTEARLVHRAESGREDFRPDPYELGRMAREARRPEESCPYADKRTKDAKEWLRGFREAQENPDAHGKPTGGA